VGGGGGGKIWDILQDNSYKLEDPPETLFIMGRKLIYLACAAKESFL